MRPLVLVALAAILAVPILAVTVHVLSRPPGAAASGAAPQSGTLGPSRAAGDGLWRGSPALWQPPAIQLSGGYFADVRRFAVTGTTQAQLIASLDRGPAGRLGWGATELRPDPFGCYPVINPFVSLKYTVVVRIPSWSPPADGSVTQDLVVRWNALLRNVFARQAGYARVYRDDMEGILTVVSMLPNCQSVVAYLNDPFTWQKVDRDRDAYEQKLQAGCRPEVGCQPAGWLGW